MAKRDLSIAELVELAKTNGVGGLTPGQLSKLRQAQKQVQKQAEAARPDGKATAAQFVETTKSISAGAIAALYGVSSQAVGLWHAKYDCPRNEDGSWNLSEVIAFWSRRHAEQLAETREKGQEKNKWLEECRRQNAITLKRKNAVAEGRLMDAADVQRMVTMQTKALKAKFDSIVRVYPAVGQMLMEAVEAVEQEFVKKFGKTAKVKA